jgi:hypothetical protein
VKNPAFVALQLADQGHIVWIDLTDGGKRRRRDCRFDLIDFRLGQACGLSRGQ